MSRKLYPFQSEAVREILKRIGIHRRVVAVAPPASGKTTIGAAVVRAFSGKRKRVLWLAHRHELLVQAREALIACGVPDEDIGLTTGQEFTNPEARILLCSIGMRPVRDVDLIVVDEAHHIAATTYQKAIGSAPVLGLTATPQRLDGKPLGDTFADLYVIVEAKKLGALGYIAIADCYGLPLEEARAIVQGVASGNDYSQPQLERAMMKGALMGNVVSECRRLANGSRTIVCAVSREHGKELARRFAADGRPTEYLDGNTPINVRKAMIGKGGRFECGETEVVVHVDVLGEGIDIPAVQCVAMCRPTKSLTLFIQQAGRAARVHDGETPIILDHAGNCQRFGLPERERTWSLEGREKCAGLGGGLVWRCDCGAVNDIEDAECRACGAVRPLMGRELEEHEAELRRIADAEKEKQKIERVLRKVAATKSFDDRWIDSARKAVS